MADITFSCPHCDQVLEAADGYAGQIIECPGCQAEITVPEESEAVHEPDELADADDLDDEEADSADEEEEGVCSECGAEMEPDTVLCMSCGYHAGLRRKMHTNFEEDT